MTNVEDRIEKSQGTAEISPFQNSSLPVSRFGALEHVAIAKWRVNDVGTGVSKFRILRLITAQVSTKFDERRIDPTRETKLNVKAITGL